MAATGNPALLSYRNPKSLFSVTTKRDSASPPSRTKISRGGGMPSATVKCANNPEQREAGGGSLKEVLAGMVDDRVEQLLNREENRVLLDDLEKASDRVEAAKRELAEIQRQESEAKQIRDYINQLESRTSQIVECQREISEARAMVEEAECSLDIDGVESLETNNIEVEIDRNEERLRVCKGSFCFCLSRHSCRSPDLLHSSNWQFSAHSPFCNHLLQLHTIWGNFLLCDKKRLGQFSAENRDCCSFWLCERSCYTGWRSAFGI